MQIQQNHEVLLKIMTTCHLNKQRLDKPCFFRWFYNRKLRFHPTAVANATDKNCVYHGKVRKAGHIEKPIYHGKLSFTMVKKKKLKCDLNHCKISCISECRGTDFHIIDVEN